MTDFYLAACLRFIKKLDMVSWAFLLPEINLGQFGTQSNFGNKCLLYAKVELKTLGWGLCKKYL